MVPAPRHLSSPRIGQRLLRGYRGAARAFATVLTLTMAVGLSGCIDPTAIVQALVADNLLSDESAPVERQRLVGQLEGNSEIIISTPKGTIRVEVLPRNAPTTSSEVLAQVLTGNYDGAEFFDVAADSHVQLGFADLAQARIPTLPVEVTGEPLDRGMVALAWVGTKQQTTGRLIFPLRRLDRLLDSHYTVFGRILEGEAILDQLVPGDPVTTMDVFLSRPLVRLRTAQGTMTMELVPFLAPITVAHFSDLVCNGFYSGQQFYEVANQLVRTGDPRNDGTGGSGAAIPLEVSDARFVRGAVGMDRLVDDASSTDSRFFIMKRTTRTFDGRFTYFARLLTGFPTLDRLQLDDQLLDVVLQFDLQGRDCNSSNNPPAGTGTGGTVGGTVGGTTGTGGNTGGTGTGGNTDNGGNTGTTQP